MKNIKISVVISLILSVTTYAQNVGINSTGATPNASAQLDLNTGNTFTSPNGRGILIPNVALTGTGDNVTCSASPATSLFVYNTATAGAGATAVSPGFYYWNGAKWIPFGAGSGWLTTGNYGTTAAANWMGSNDANDVVFKADGNEVFRMGNANKNLMVNSINNTNAFLSSTTSGALHGIYSLVTGASTGNAIFAETQSTTTDAIVAKVTNAASGVNAITADATGGNNNGNAIQALSKGVPNVSTIFANNTVQSAGAATGSGTAFVISATNHAIAGQITGNFGYSFGVYGAIVNAPAPSGGVIGYYGSNYWGSLGYHNTAGTTSYGGYFATSSVAAGAVTGRAANDNTSKIVSSDAAIGAYGDLFGGWIRGNVYGMAVRGERVSLYVDGKTVVNQPIIQLSKTNDNKTIVNYTPASATADLQLHGVAKMENGAAIIVLDAETISQFITTEDITIIATPTSQTNGVYAELKGNQLSIKENNGGKSNTKVSWVIIGQRNIDNTLPDEFKDKDFDTNLRGFMHNENDKSTKATGLYWDGTKLNTSGWKSSPNTGTPLTPEKKQ